MMSLPKWCGTHYIERITRGIEQCKALVVLGGDDEVLHAAFLGERDPFLRVKIDWLERPGKRFDLAVRDLEIGLRPFRVIRRASSSIFAGKHGIDAEMDHHSVFCLPEPFAIVHGFVFLRVSTVHGVSFRVVLCGIAESSRRPVLFSLYKKRRQKAIDFAKKPSEFAHFSCNPLQFLLSLAYRYSKSHCPKLFGLFGADFIMK